MSLKLLKIVFVVLVLVIVAESIVLLLASTNGFNYKNLLSTVNIFKNEEILIGKDFIGLSSSKIQELLKLPENKDKFILPVYADDYTRIEILQNQNKNSDSNNITYSYLNITTSDGGMLLNPASSGINECGYIGGDPKRKNLRIYFQDKKFFITTTYSVPKDDAPDGVKQIELSDVVQDPSKWKEIKFGDVLARGLMRFPEKQYSVTIIPTIDKKINDPIPNPIDHLLKYKGKIVCLIKQ